MDGSTQARPTIRDVAREAGVSKSLVSLVFQNSDKVSQQRRAAVLRAAAELGYRPNLIARSLSASTTGLIGVLASDLTNAFFAEVVAGAQTALSDGQTLLLGSGREQSADAEEHIVERFLQQGVDGLLLLAPHSRHSTLRQAATSVPTVIVGLDGRVPNADIINANEDLGCRLAVAHLANLGHRHIAFLAVGGITSPLPRERGYLGAMTETGLEDAIHVVPAEGTTAGAEHATTDLLARATPPTAIFAHNDHMAVGAIAALDRAGLRVPEDVSIIGYDDIALAATPRLSLTTVHLPRPDIGTRAMQRLTERIADPIKNGSVHQVTPRLVVRGTTGPGPRRT